MDLVEKNASHFGHGNGFWPEGKEEEPKVRTRRWRRRQTEDQSPNRFKDKCVPVCVSMCLCRELAQGKTLGQKGQVIFWTELEYAFFFPLA